MDAQERLFPSDGVRAYVYMADIDYFANQEKILNLTRALEDSGEIKVMFRNLLIWCMT